MPYKYGLYNTKFNRENGGRLTLPVEYDNFFKNSRKTSTIICEKDGKKRFIFFNDTTEELSEFFDSISFDKYLLFCKKNNVISVYSDLFAKLLMTTDADDISVVNANYNKNVFDKYDNCRYYLEIVKNGKHEINFVEGYVSKFNYTREDVKITNKTMLPMNYDYINKIKVDDSITDKNYYKIGNNGKEGLFITGKNYGLASKTIEPEYEKIDYLGNDYFGFYKDGLCDIRKVNFYNATEGFSVNGCQLAERMPRGIRYKKNNKYGIIFDERTIVPPIYSDIMTTEINVSRFIVWKDNKKGLINDDANLLIPPVYDDIEIHRYVQDYYPYTYYKLKQYNKYKVAKIIRDKSASFEYKEKAKYITENFYEKVEFLPDIMILQSEFHKSIYDCLGNLIKILPASSVITVHDFVENGEKKNYYFIDGSYYKYENGKLVEIHKSHSVCYCTTYRTNDDIYEVKSYDKLEHDVFCEYIDAKEELEAEKELLKLAKNEKMLRANYATLILKRTKNV